ncbi:MAG: tripartite tricarboxylate transporter permease [Candidatus Aenigmatarchaeota archaeon]
MIEYLFFTLIGCGLGIITGLIPGLHVNTVSFGLIGFVFLNPYYVIIMIIAMAITHTIFDYIPSIFFGAPDPSTALSVLPGHQMLLDGRGLHALYLTVVGGMLSIFITLLLFPLFLISIPFLYQNIQSFIHWILIAIALVMLYAEPGKKKFYGLIIFLLSGTLGMITLNSFLLPSHLIMFPLFTGLFGISTMLISLNKKTKIPKQVMWLPKIGGRFALIGTLKGLFSGMLLGVLPGVGAAQATVLTQQITRKHNPHEFLISIGAINTIVALFSLISLYTIFRPRSGAAVAIDSIIQSFGFTELMLLLGVALLSTSISTFLILKLARPLITVLQKVNYTKLTIVVIIFLISMTAYFTQLPGLLILGVSTSIGLLAPLYGVKRSMSMGVLMLPLIIFYAGV